MERFMLFIMSVSIEVTGLLKGDAEKWNQFFAVPIMVGAIIMMVPYVERLVVNE
jgi:hypothetical protein